MSLLVLLIYRGAGQAGFLWDDGTLIYQSPLLTSPQPWQRIWLSTDATDYYPVTWSVLLLEWRAFGSHPAGYHLVQVALHLISSLLLWRVLAALRLPGAWMAALLFAVHPTQVATVMWVSQHKNTIALIGYLLCTLLWIRSLEHVTTEQAERPAEGDARGEEAPQAAQRLRRLAFACYVLALLSKTSGLLWPMVLALCEHLQLGHIRHATWRRLLPFAAAGAGAALVTVWFQQQRAMGGEAAASLPLWIHAALPGWILLHYLYRALLPVQLTMIYPLGTTTDHTRLLVPLLSPGGTALAATDLLTWLPTLGGVAIFLLAWRKRTSPGGTSTLQILAYQVAVLLPVAGLVPMYFHRFAFVSDHLGQLSTLGTLAAACALAAKRSAQHPRFQVLAGSVATGLLTLAAWNHQAVYRSPAALWEDTLAKNPRAWVAHFNLGSVLEDQHAYERALDCYHEALRSVPQDAPLWYNTGHALFELRRYSEAARAYEEALRLRPRYAEASNNAGACYEALGQAAKARAAYERALQLRPSYAEAHCNLGHLLWSQRDPAAAEQHLVEALRLRPHANREAHNHLARIYIDQQQATRALPHLQAALQVDVSYADAWLNLGRALYQLERHKGAEAALQHAVTQAPGLGEAWFLRGRNAERTHDSKLALRCYEEASRLQPTDPLPLNNLAWLLATRRGATAAEAARALELATTACKLSDAPTYIDTQATALAACGRYREAVHLLDTLLARIPAEADRAELLRHRARFASQRAWVE